MYKNKDNVNDSFLNTWLEWSCKIIKHIIVDKEKKKRAIEERNKVNSSKKSSKKPAKRSALKEITNSSDAQTDNENLNRVLYSSKESLPVDRNTLYDSGRQ